MKSTILGLLAAAAIPVAVFGSTHGTPELVVKVIQVAAGSLIVSQAKTFAGQGDEVFLLTSQVTDVYDGLIQALDDLDLLVAGRC